jgi:hypothetical protein
MIAMRTSARIAAVLLAMAMVAAAPRASAAEGAKPDDIARFLAGLPPSPESPIASLTREPGWQQHARSFNSAWSGLEQRQLSKIRAWSAANLTAPQPVVLYMFSGPDFLYADAFLGNRSTYVLSGLEPVGQIPMVTEASRRSLYQGLAGLRSSLSSVLNYSFFITKQMRSSLSANTFKGTLPVLYIFLARSGKTIQDVSLVAIDKDGAVVPAGQDGMQGAGSAPGVKIVFAGADGRAQTLYYFRTDISDHGLKGSGFLKFCEQLGKAESFVKSASYLMHSDSFSKIRELLLSRSEALIQDDSGIPVRFFKPDEWELRPFGRYLGPISIFAGRYQRQLSEVFRKSNPPRLDFGVGYRFRHSESNLLLAVKKAK